MIDEDLRGVGFMPICQIDHDITYKRRFAAQYETYCNILRPRKIFRVYDNVIIGTSSSS
jgi:hypothetical protein